MTDAYAATLNRRFGLTAEEIGLSVVSQIAFADRWVPSSSAEAGASSKSDLNVFAKAFEEGLERGEIAEALA